MKQKIKTFQASDTDGNVYTLEQWQDQIPAGNFNNPSATVGGTVETRTSTGEKVQYMVHPGEAYFSGLVHLKVAGMSDGFSIRPQNVRTD